MIVADVNVVAYLVLPGPHTPGAEAAYRKDPDWVAPHLWRSELLNVLATYMRVKGMSRVQAVEAFDFAQRIVPHPPMSTLPTEILRLSAASGCTSYDCEYVALAEALRLPLVTADKQVVAAFPAIAVSITDFVK